MDHVTGDGTTGGTPAEPGGEPAATLVPGGRSPRRRALGLGVLAGVALAVAGGGAALAASGDEDPSGGSTAVEESETPEESAAEQDGRPSGAQRPERPGAGETDETDETTDRENCGPGGVGGSRTGDAADRELPGRGTPESDGAEDEAPEAEIETSDV